MHFVHGLLALVMSVGVARAQDPSSGSTLTFTPCWTVTNWVAGVDPECWMPM